MTSRDGQRPEVRAARMRVIACLERLTDGRTRVELVHGRWSDGEDWRQAHDDFVSARDLG